MDKRYEILDHPADLKIRAFGKDLKEIFVNAALAVAKQQAPEINKFYPEQSRRAGNLARPRPPVGGSGEAGETEEIAVESDSLESLLVDWLSEILYRGEINKKVYTDFDVAEFSEKPYKPPHRFPQKEIGAGDMPFRCGGKIKAKIRGAPVGLKNTDIKAVTYHELEIKKIGDHWEAILVFDI